MKKLLMSIVLSAFAAVGVDSAHAVVITTAGGSVSGFEKIAEFFDAQPTTVPTSGATTDDFGTAGAFYLNAGRAYYFDFGENFADITLTEVFLGLKLNGFDPGAPTEANFYWSPTNVIADATYDAVGRGHIAATGAGTGSASGVGGDFNFFNFTAATNVKSWESVWSGSLTPQARYYIGSFVDGTGFASNRPEEIVFVGTVVPEPSTMALLAIGLLSFAVRRRRA